MTQATHRVTLSVPLDTAYLAELLLQGREEVSDVECSTVNIYDGDQKAPREPTLGIRYSFLFEGEEGKLSALAWVLFEEGVVPTGTKWLMTFNLTPVHK